MQLRDAFKFYHQRVRLFLRLSGVTIEQLSAPSSLLFGQWNQPHLPCSVDVIKTFTGRTLGIHLSSTDLRKVQETESAAALREGRITESQRNSVSKVNGHRGKVGMPIIPNKEYF